MNKKRLLFPLLAVFCWLMLSPTAWGQLDYASAYSGAGSYDLHPIIRTVNSTSVLVCYQKGIHCEIALIDQTGSMKIAKLKDGYFVRDMRITGENVYFCGTVQGHAFLGHLKHTGYTPSAWQVKYFNLAPNYTSELSRMVAYDIGGQQKVVAVGFYHFDNTGSFPCPSYPGQNCIKTFVVEVNFNGDTPVGSPNLVYSNDLNHFEIITEVIETESHVAIVGYITDHYNTVLNSTVIHCCGKSNVAFDFQTIPYHYYYTPDEGHSDFHGCWMKGDTIAISSLSTYNTSVGQQFSTNVRVFDLTTMANIQSQLVPLNTKSEPYDLMYMQGEGRLVLLQDIYHPIAASVQNTFVHLKPYFPAAYSANCWYRTYSRDGYRSLSRLSSDRYFAAGGEFWCMKDLYSFNSRCIIRVDISVEEIDKVSPNTFLYVYYAPPLPLTVDASSSCDITSIIPLCY